MFETMIPYVLGDHLYGHTFDPPQGGFGYPRALAPAPALQDARRLRLLPDLHRPALGDFLERHRQG
jgi:hypothetical protein